MIGYVKGTLADLFENTAVIDVNGIGINVSVSDSLFYELGHPGTEVMLYTYTYVKEDSFCLYGFRCRDELNLFKKLISVSGIGPKGGLAILSVLSADELRFAICSGDVKTIAKAPGIGKKTAERVVLELKDKISVTEPYADFSSDPDFLSGDTSISGVVSDAIEALTALGYPKTEAARAVRNCNPTPDMEVEQILKASLKYLL